MDNKYDLDEFKKACENPDNIFVPPDVLKDARDIFSLKTKKDLLYFIADNCLEKAKFINCTEYRKMPDVCVDAYEFRANRTLGYIAFGFIDKTKKWIIKSFHISENQNETMAIALKKAGLI